MTDPTPPSAAPSSSLSQRVRARIGWRGVAMALGLAALTWWSGTRWGWQGVALVISGVTMWLLLQMTRLITVFRRASNRPIGHVASAVMLNAKLRRGASLLHVIALTRSLGETMSPPEVEPQRLRWSDTGGARVTCSFVDGRLQDWTLERPEAPTPVDTALTPLPAAD